MIINNLTRFKRKFTKILNNMPSTVATITQSSQIHEKRVPQEEYRYKPGYGWVSLKDFMFMRDDE